MTGRYAGARSLCYGTAMLLAPLAGLALYRLNPAAPWGACGAAGIGAAVITLNPRAKASSTSNAAVTAAKKESPQPDLRAAARKAWTVPGNVGPGR
jgi:hypothetical protein